MPPANSKRTFKRPAYLPPTQEQKDYLQTLRDKLYDRQIPLPVLPLRNRGDYKKFIGQCIHLIDVDNHRRKRIHKNIPEYHKCRHCVKLILPQITCRGRKINPNDKACADFVDVLRF